MLDDTKFNLSVITLRRATPSHPTDTRRLKSSLFNLMLHLDSTSDYLRLKPQVRQGWHLKCRYSQRGAMHIA